MAVKSPAAVLDLPANAGRDDVRRRYRELVATEHPDKHPDDPLAVERFQRIQEAYQKLMDNPRTAAQSLDGIDIQGKKDTLNDEDFGSIFSDRVRTAGPRVWRNGKLSSASSSAPGIDQEEEAGPLMQFLGAMRIVIFAVALGAIVATVVYISCDRKEESYCRDLGIEPRAVRVQKLKAQREAAIKEPSQSRQQPYAAPLPARPVSSSPAF